MAKARETRIARTTRRAKSRTVHTVATVAELRRRARRRLAALSPERLQVALDFLAYLEERECSAATDELLRIPGFVDTLKVAEDEAAKAGWADWHKVRRDV